LAAPFIARLGSRPGKLDKISAALWSNYPEYSVLLPATHNLFGTSEPFGGDLDA